MLTVRRGRGTVTVGLISAPLLVRKALRALQELLGRLVVTVLTGRLELRALLVRRVLMAQTALPVRPVLMVLPAKRVLMAPMALPAQLGLMVQPAKQVTMVLTALPGRPVPPEPILWFLALPARLVIPGHKVRQACLRTSTS